MLKFIKDTLITFSTQIITVILGIPVAIVIARALGPEGKGAYSLIILIPALLALLSNLGIGIANVYFLRTRKHRITDLTSNSLVSSLVLGLSLAMAAITYFHFFRPSFLGDISMSILVIAVLMTPLLLLFENFRFLLLGKDKVNQYNLLNIIQAGTVLVLVLILVWTIKAGLLGAISAWSGAILLSAILSVLLVRKLTEVRWAFHLTALKDTVKFGVKSYLGNIIQFLNYRLDMFLVGYFINITAIGYYSISVALVEALWFFPSAAAMMVYAQTPELSKEQANISTPVICRNTLLITSLSALLLFVLGRLIISLFFGAVFLSALKPLWILLPGVVAFSVCRVLSNELAGRGKPIIITIMAAISLGVNIPLNLLLIPRWGITGAAFASTIAYAVATLVVLIAFVRETHINCYDLIIPKRKDIRIYLDFLSIIRKLKPRHLINILKP